MARAPSGTHHEGLKVARLLMVLSSISPLFICVPSASLREVDEVF